MTSYRNLSFDPFGFSAGCPAHDPPNDVARLNAMDFATDGTLYGVFNCRSFVNPGPAYLVTVDTTNPSFARLTEVGPIRDGGSDIPADGLAVLPP